MSYKLALSYIPGVQAPEDVHAITTALMRAGLHPKYDTPTKSIFMDVSGLHESERDCCAESYKAIQQLIQEVTPDKAYVIQERWVSVTDFLQTDDIRAGGKTYASSQVLPPVANERQATKS